MSEEKKLPRSSPPVMPMGFRTGNTDDVMFIDLLDIPSREEARIFYTIALTKGSAKNLLKSLKAFIEE
ncbi:hypothetical protein [Pseudomonas viridiflava]|uniref:hypothetical protein n=1 Tax=Pseudomonas viridiflava TaxID=33069 RepID=UPI0013CF29A1|nr:hypothetical protein [Pseudomonas viridiflava]